MPDVIVSADTVTRPVAPPTVQVELPAPVARADEMLPQDGGDVVLKRINDPIDSGPDSSGLREAMRREREGDPIVEWKGGNLPPPGESESHGKQLKKISQGMHLSRKAAAAQELRDIGLGHVAEAAVDAAFAAPDTKVLPVADAGPDGLPAYRIEPLRDDQPITEDVSFKNLNEAKRAMSNFRDAQERYQRELLEAFSAKQDQERAQAADLERIERERALPKPAPQPDPAQVERARLEAQQRQVQAQAYWNQLAEQERQAAPANRAD